jgi:hypothetical protein
MFSPGDVVGFWSDIAGKHKYHLCVHQDRLFLFINSPKRKPYPGDFNVPSSEIPCLPATPEGYSIISCTHLVRQTDAELKRLKAKKYGVIYSKVLLRLIAFVEKTPVLSDEDKDAIIEGLADWT